jgi:hypothetical protein
MGDIFVILCGLFLAVVGALVTFFALGIGAVFGLWGVICGVIMVVGGAIMNSRPQQHWMWGMIVLIFSILSLGSLGGLFMGFILGLIGGALGMAWRPSPAEPVQPMNLWVCPSCGGTANPNASFCPHCGRQMPAWLATAGNHWARI